MHESSASHSIHSHPTVNTSFPSAGTYENNYTGPTIALPEGTIDVTYGAAADRKQPILDPWGSQNVGVKQGEEECFALNNDGTNKQIPCTDNSCGQDIDLTQGSCQSDALHPCNEKFTDKPATGAVGEYGAAAVSITHDPGIPAKEVEKIMPNAAMQRSPERPVMAESLSRSSVPRSVSASRTPRRASTSRTRMSPQRSPSVISIEDDEIGSPPPLVPVAKSPVKENSQAVVAMPEPSPRTRRPIPTGMVQGGLGLSSQQFCQPASSSSSAPVPFAMPTVKVPPAIPGPTHANAIQTTIRNPKAVVEERRQFVRCTGPCCDPAAAASLAQQQMQLQMHLHQQQQQQMAQQQAAAKNAPKAAPIMVTPYQHKWLISGQTSENKYNWAKEFGCAETMQKVNKAINPKRMCTKMLDPKGTVKEGCGIQ